MAGEEKFGYFCISEGTDGEDGSFSSGCGWLEVVCVWRWELTTDCSSFVCEKSGKVISCYRSGGGGQRRELNVLKGLRVSWALLILLWKYEDLAVWTSAEKDESKDWYLLRSDGSFDLHHFLSAALSLVRCSRRTSDNQGLEGAARIKVTHDCLHTLTPWCNMTLYRRGVLIGQVIRRKTVTTDASSTGWGAVCDGRPAFGMWSETEKSWHINCLELHAVHLALECFLPDILHHHVLIRMDSMTVVAFINHQGGVSSWPLLRLARALLLWADRHLLSIRAGHVPGCLNYADLLSRGGVIHREWRLHPLTVNMILSIFGRADVVLFASAENTHCPLFVCFGGRT